jgi:hypothetical protein
VDEQNQPTTEHLEQAEQEPQITPKMRALQIKMGLFVGCVAGAADLVFQGGWTGLAVGGVAAFLLAKSSPEIAEDVKERLEEIKELYAEIREAVPYLFPSRSGGHNDRTWYQRAMGIYPEGDKDQMSDEEAIHAYIQTHSPSSEETDTQQEFSPLSSELSIERLMVLYQQGEIKEQNILAILDQLLNSRIADVEEEEEEEEGTSRDLPPLSIFEALPKTTGIERSEVSLMEQALADILGGFGVHVTIEASATMIGPRIICFGLVPTGKPIMLDATTPKRDDTGRVLYSSRTKIEQITNREKDIQLALGAQSIRILPPVPGKRYVGVEIPNPRPVTVGLSDVLSDPSYRQASETSRLVFALGRDISGSVRFCDIARAPHLLIAGTTGAGKSMLINVLLASLLTQATPDEVRLVMIDPKQVELTPYNGIAHLLAPVVTDINQVSGLLEGLIEGMEERYQIFSSLGVRTIESYRKRRSDRIAQGEAPLPPLPSIVVIVDEFADLMMTTSKQDDVEGKICRLAQKARAVGIHLVIATQRPSKEVLTGLIKANIPTCIALKTKAEVDSRIILDQGGAEKLLGNGDMLYLPSDTTVPIRIQGAFMTDIDAASLSSYWQQDRSSAARPIEEEPDTPNGTVLNFDELRERYTPLRSSGERYDGPSYGRDSTDTSSLEGAQIDPKFADLEGYGSDSYDRNLGRESAPEDAVRVQDETVSDRNLPPGWTDSDLSYLPGFYRVSGDLDKTLLALGKSTSKRNRDFARGILESQGLRKEAR